jgi:hypothetical protein
MKITSVIILGCRQDVWLLLSHGFLYVMNYVCKIILMHENAHPHATHRDQSNWCLSVGGGQTTCKQTTFITMWFLYTFWLLKYVLKFRMALMCRRLWYSGLGNSTGNSLWLEYTGLCINWPTTLKACGDFLWLL